MTSNLKNLITLLLFLLVISPCRAEITKITLTLEDVLLRVERNHPKLKGADLERRLASAKRLEKQGAFDPSIVIENDTQRYNSYPKRGTQKDELLNDVSLSLPTRFGAKLSLNSSLHYGDVKSPASGTGDLGTHFLGLSLPLLRGAGINEKFASEKKAILGEPLANAEYQQYRIAILQKASASYWEWVSSKLKLDIQHELLKLAENRFQQIKGRVDSGDLPKIDSIEAEQEIQRRQETTYKSQRDFQKYTFSMASYLWNEQSTAIIYPEISQSPDKIPEPEEISQESLNEAKLIALEKRPELAQIDALKQISDVDLSYAKNQLLPILDLYAAPGIDTGQDSIGPVFKAGVTMLVPLRNRTARGQVEQAKLKLQKLDFDKKQLIQQVLLEVQDTVSELNNCFQRYLASKSAYDLAQQLQEGEQEKFNLGDSTLFLVNQRERSTAEALIKLVEVKAEYQQACVRLAAVTGIL